MKKDITEERYQATLKEIGDAVRRYRNEKRIGYIDAAKEIGIEKKTLYAMERGELNFQIKTLFKVLDYFSISFLDFINTINKSVSKPNKTSGE